ncbi:MAG: sporulation initiation factor Spo0A C-terminal domain-containing protein [Christensenellales bacterium]
MMDIYESMNMKDLYERLARENNTTPQEVEFEMSVAIQKAWQTMAPEERAKIPCQGEFPTNEEFITYASALIEDLSSQGYPLQ